MFRWFFSLHNWGYICSFYENFQGMYNCNNPSRRKLLVFSSWPWRVFVVVELISNIQDTKNALNYSNLTVAMVEVRVKYLYNQYYGKFFQDKVLQTWIANDWHLLDQIIQSWFATTLMLLRKNAARQILKKFFYLACIIKISNLQRTWKHKLLSVCHEANIKHKKERE